jgi:hypothetical protein
MISLVYPVRLYACSGECGWTGLAGLKWRHHPHPSDGIEEDVSGIPEQ